MSDRHEAVSSALREHMNHPQDAEHLADVVIGALDELAASRVDLSGPAPLHKDASEAQRETVEALDDLSDRRREALLLVSLYGEEGATCDQMEIDHRKLHQSLSGTLSELENKYGLVERDETRRIRTSSEVGRANPYRLTGVGRALLDSD